MLAKINALVSLMLLAISALGQEVKIDIPPFNDKYSIYVRQLESGQLNIDYTDFRNSFLDSRQFARKGVRYDSLEKQVYQAVRDKNYVGVIKATKGMLSLDYTSLTAHKYLQQTYKILGDTAASRHYHDIEFGLLRSIIQSGDGKACATGWHVTQIEEEYFILRMKGADLQRQSISNDGNNNCDRMEVKLENGEKRTYYFEANKVFDMERKSFAK